MALRSLLLAVALAGCARERPLAPTEMTDLVRFMFQSWEDEALLAEAVDHLAPWLDAHVPGEQAEDGYRLDPLTPADVADVERPDADLAALIGAAGGAVSPFPVSAHAGHVLEADQAWSNPGQYDAYHRTVTGDQAAFLAGAGVVRTTNEVTTTSFGITIPYVLLKDYRWVRSEGGEEAIVARSWTEERGCNDGGGSCLEQSFSIDLFGADGDSTVRFTASWTEVTSPVPLPEDTLIASLALGLQKVFTATDAHLAEGP